MKLFFLAACILAGCGASAQNSNLDFKYALKFSNYSTFAHYESYLTDAYNYKIHDNDWVSPALSLLVKNKKNNFHEFELTSIGFDQTKIVSYDPTYIPNPSTANSVQSHITLQYQYVQNFLKNKKSRWMPWIAAGASAEYSRTKSSGQNYYSTTNELVFIGRISPGVNYNISKRFFASASVPVAVFRSLSDFTNAKNYDHPDQNQNIQDNDFSFFPTLYTFKLSLGLKL